MRGRGWAVVAVLATLVPAPARAQISAWRLQPVQRVRSPLVGTADVGGRVFEDRNGDGRWEPGEPGIPDVTVALGDGRYARTDGAGRYQLPEIAPGQRSVAVRPATLPTGGRPEGPAAVVEVPPGAFVRVDLPVRLATDTVSIGRPPAIGWRLTPRLEELPVNVVGNATDIQALENGRRVPFPTADIVYRGLSRGGFVRPGRLARVQVHLVARGAGAPSGWTLALATGAGRVLHTWTGTGAPPARFHLDPRSLAGVTVPAPGAYVLRLCVERRRGAGACSPYRPFGLETGRGRRQVRPKLAIPDVTPRAEIAGHVAHLDPDGSFIQAVRPGTDRTVTLRLLRTDGREAHTRFTLPRFALGTPAGPVAIHWGAHTATYTAPAAPGPVTVHLAGRASPGARIVLGRTTIPVSGGRWRHTAAAAPGRTRLELTVAAPSGSNTLFELDLALSDRTASGAPLVVRPGVPDLSVTLPVAGAAFTGGEVRIRGRAAAGATVTAGGRPVPVTADGRFDARVPAPGGRLVLEVRDARGEHGEVTRTWHPRLAANAGGALADGEPYLRIVHAHPLPYDAGTHLGLAGAARASLARWHRGGLRLFAGLTLAPVPRTPGTAVGPDIYGEGALRAGAEGFVGRRVVLGLRYDGLVLFGPGGGGVPMRHTATATAALLGRDVDVLVDLGADDDRSVGQPESLLAGGGLGVRWRATDTVDVRLRVGADLSLTAATAGPRPEVVDAAGQVSWQSPSGAVVSLRLAHLEDRRPVDPEAAGDVAHLALDLPIGRHLHVLEVLGGWLVQGTVTGLDVTRLEVTASPALLVALDYRLETQGSGSAHALTLEGDWRLGAHLRVGVLYGLRDVTGGGELSSQALARVEAIF